jgi:rubrerythrin
MIYILLVLGGMAIVMNKNMIQDIIDYAIEREKESYNFYKSSAERVDDKSLKSIFEELAAEEVSHKDFLEDFLKSGATEINIRDFDDYNVSATVEKPTFTEEMSFTDAVALAMKKEEEAMELYQKLAASTENPDKKELFLNLAKMEQLHKAKLEELYTNTAYAEVW